MLSVAIGVCVVCVQPASAVMKSATWGNACDMNMLRSNDTMCNKCVPQCLLVPDDMFNTYVYVCAGVDDGSAGIGLMKS